jgi:cell division protease FtsH
MKTMPIERDSNPPNPSPRIRPPKVRHIAGSFLLWLGLLMLINWVAFEQTQPEQIAYSDFIAQVEADRVASAVVSSSRIEYELKDAQPERVLVTTPVAIDLDLPKILREHKVKFSARLSNENSWMNLLVWMVPALVFMGLWNALSSQGGIGGTAALTVGKSKARIYSEGDTGVILLAATNRPEVLDPALRRPGRFDRSILIDRPDRIGREAILNIHARNVLLAEDVDLAKLAARTPGFAGADLANLVNEAALLAARRDRNAVTMADFNEALERVLTGLEKKSRVLNETEKKTVAYHEVGHALIATLMPGTGKVEKISVVPRGFGALGYTLQLPEEDRFLVTEDEIRGRIATLLGGRSAEELIFAKVSTGASDDIQKATDLAERFVTLYGMSSKLGPIAFEKAQQQFLEGFTNPRRSVSAEVTAQIDREVKQLINSAHAIAELILSENKTLLEETAQMLLAKEVLEGQELRSQLERVCVPEAINEWLQTGVLPPSSISVPNSHNGSSKLGIGV